MEMKPLQKVFPVFLLLLAFGFCTGRSPNCESLSECDASFQFCDSGTGTCKSCSSMPCSATYMEGWDDKWCKQLCPEYWKNHVMSTSTVKTLTSTEAKSPDQEDGANAEKSVQNSAQEKTEDVNQDSVKRNGLAVGLVALGLVAAISTGIGIYVIKKRRAKALRPPQQEFDLNPEKQAMVVPGLKTRGPIAQEQMV